MFRAPWAQIMSGRMFGLVWGIFERFVLGWFRLNFPPSFCHIALRNPASIQTLRVDSFVDHSGQFFLRTHYTHMYDFEKLYYYLYI